LVKAAAKHVLVLVALLYPAAGAKVAFRSYELRYKPQELLFFDFDGNGFDDIVVADEPNLVFFFQDTKRGFRMNPTLNCSLAENPAVFWPAKMGNDQAESVLVMTSDGVSRLRYAGNSEPAAREKIIERPTLIPEQTEELRTVYFTLSARTAGPYPLIIIPTEDNLEIWQYEQGWRCAQLLETGVQEQIWGPYEGLGYRRQLKLNMNIGDLSQDGLDDLVVCQSSRGGTNKFCVYMQTGRGTFCAEPNVCFEDEWNWRTWIGVSDLNKDSSPDFVKSTWLHEPWFIPGTRSGKVLVQIFLSDSFGRLPERAQYVFRKHDWISSLPLVDIDGDGFTDITLGYALMRGREDIRKSLTAKKLDHNLRFHFFYGNGYSDVPDCRKDVTIDTGQSGIHLTWSRRDYLQRLVSLDGDFNGDGRRDLLVKDRSNEASVYFFRSREAGFSGKADMRFRKIKSVERFVIEDLNNDRISDLVVVGSKKDMLRVFLSESRKR